MYDIQHPPEIRLELIPYLVFILIFTRANDAVAAAIGYYVHFAPVREGGLEHGVDGFADADVAEEREVGGTIVGGRGG